MALFDWIPQPTEKKAEKKERYGTAETHAGTDN